MQRIQTVKVPVTNLRNTPSVLRANSYKKDVSQESQILFNEQVEVIEKRKNWTLVEALEQPHKGFQGYKGWVRTRDLFPCQVPVSYDVFVTSLWADVHLSLTGSVLIENSGHCIIKVSFGTGFKRLHQTSEMTEVLLPDGSKGKISNSELVSEKMSEHAKKFLGSPYLWGGRSAFDALHHEATGVDCSGLISLLCRVSGIKCPRNAVDQWKQCKRIDREELTEGDLIFSSTKGKTESIDHVMLYCGDGKVIESAMGVGKVHEIALKEKMRRFPNDQFFFGRLKR